MTVTQVHKRECNFLYLADVAVVVVVVVVVVVLHVVLYGFVKSL